MDPQSKDRMTVSFESFMKSFAFLIWALGMAELGADGDVLDQAVHKYVLQKRMVDFF